MGKWFVIILVVLVAAYILKKRVKSISKNIVGNLPGLIGLHKATRFTISGNGINKIAEHEGKRHKAYADQGGKMTIGIGHLITPDETHLLDATLTENQIIDLFLQDIKWAENAIKRSVLVPITQNQFDALVSFVFNVGSGNFSKSTLLKKLNAKNALSEVAAEFKRWINVNGKPNDHLMSRRAKEANLFLS